MDLNDVKDKLLAYVEALESQSMTKDEIIMDMCQTIMDIDTAKQ